MKLLRYGPLGHEKPGLLDARGQIRDLSSQIDDVNGQALAPEILARLARLDPATLPTATGVTVAADIKDRTIKYAVLYNVEHPHGLGAQKFAELVAQKSEG